MSRQPVKLRYRILGAARPGALLGIIIGLLLIASCADRVLHMNASPHSSDWKLDKQVGVVTHVADGDTLLVKFDNDVEPVRIRLIGIDTPEMNSTAGEAARNYTLARCGEKRVTIRLDSLQATRDKHGRLLAYVYLPNHELLNNSIIRDGHAFVYRPKRCDFSSLFETTENQARTGKRGMWKTITVDEMPPWRQAWMKERGLK